MITAADTVRSPFNINTNNSANSINRRSPSLSISTDSEPSTPISSTSSSKTRSNHSKKTNTSSIRRRRDAAATAHDDSSDIDHGSQEHLLKKKKAAHNIIEKRYRTNMNAKFAALSSALPGAPNPSQKSNAERGHKKSVSGSAGGCCQNKSEVLSNALAYIHQLQEENGSLKGEISVLKENLLPRGMVRLQQQRQR
jgi:hypothetical protein